MKSVLQRSFCIISMICTVASLNLEAQQFAIIGDFRNKTEATAQVASLVKKWNPDFILTCGDNYELSIGTIDDQVGQFYSDYIYPYKGVYPSGQTVNRFYPTIGNHDLSLDGLPLYLDYFSLPGNERYYDFVQGSVHFFMLNSNSFEPDGITSSSVQANWLKTQMEKSNTNWKIVILHNPPYSSGNHGSDSTFQWPFFTWGANAVIAGHDHTFERILLGDSLYFVNGIGGSGIYGFPNFVSGSQMRYNGNYGAQRVYASENELKFEFYTITDSLVDSYILKRNNSRIRSLNSKDEIIVFPNPSNNYISLTIHIDGISVVNSLGQTIMNLNKPISPNTPIEIGHLPKGVYYLKIHNSDGYKYARFFKQR